MGWLDANSPLIPFAVAWGASRLIGMFVQLPGWASLLIGLAVLIAYQKVLGSGRSVTGQKSPSLQGLKYVQGSDIPVGDGRNVAVVEFWATWCPPCRTSIPHLNKLYNQYKDRGVSFVGITSEGESVVNAFIKKMGDDFSYPVALDTSNSVTQAFPVAGIPVAFVVGKDGSVVWQGHPMKDLEVGIEKALSM